MRTNQIPKRVLAPGSKPWTQFGVQYLVDEQAPIVTTDYVEVPIQSMKPLSAKCDPDTGNPCAMWWTVNVNAFEMFRLVPAGTTVTLPKYTDIQGVGLPSTPVQLRLFWDGSAVDIDIGSGTRVSVLAPTLSARLLVPSQIYVVNSNTPRPEEGITPPAGQGDRIVADMTATISVTCSDAPLGDRVATLTRTYTPLGNDLPSGTFDQIAVNPAGTSAYRIPPRARRVQWSASNLGASPGAGVGPQYLAPGNTAGPYARGQYDAWGRAMTEIHDVPKNATYFSLATLDQVVPFATAVWELEM